MEPRTSLALLLVLLVWPPPSMAQGGAAVPSDGIKPWLGDLAGEVAKDTPFEPIKKLMDALDLASFADDVLRNCLAAGGSTGDCTGFAGWCVAAKLFTPASIGPIPVSMILPPIDKYCLGEPVLKCCKTTKGCHSAFNAPAPINCEGNPHYGPTHTAGLCLRPGVGRPGCVCNYLAECLTGRRRRLLSDDDSEAMSLPEDEPRHLREAEALAADPEFLRAQRHALPKLLDSQYRFHNLSHHNITRYYVDEDFNFPSSLSNLILAGGRRDAFMMNLTTTIRKLPKEMLRSRGFRDLVTYRGCKGWMTDIASRVDFTPKNLTIRRTGVRNRVVAESDVFGRAVRFSRYAQYVAAFRTLASIPNFWGRVDLLVSFRWGPKSIQTHLDLLHGTTPGEEAARLLSPIALFILKRAQPTLWPLLFVPLDYERGLNATDARPGATLDGCELGSAPELHLDTKTDEESRSVAVRVELALEETSARLGIPTPVRVSWGDGRVESFPVAAAVSASQQEDPVLEHSYDKPGAYRISVSAMSLSGHHRLVSQCALVGVDSPNAPGWAHWPPPADSASALRSLTLHTEAVGHHRYGTSSGTLMTLFQLSESEPVRDLDLPAYDALIKRGLGADSLATVAPPNKGSFSATPYAVEFDHRSGSRVHFIIVKCRAIGAYLYSGASIAVRDVVGVFSADETGIVEDLDLNVNFTVVRAFRHIEVTKPSSKDGETRIEPLEINERGVYQVRCSRPGWNVWASMVLEVEIPDDSRSLRQTEGCRRSGSWQGVREDLEEVLGPLLNRDQTTAVTLAMRHLGDSAPVHGKEEETCLASIRVHSNTSGSGREVAVVDVDDVGAVEGILADSGLVQEGAFSFVGERSWECLTDCVPHCQGREWRTGRWTRRS